MPGPLGRGPAGGAAGSSLAGAAESRQQYGLDDQALRAARYWTFEPGSGTLGGVPVPVIVRLNIEFRIH